MANGRFLIGKSSGGVTTVTSVDGASNTTLVLPESGVLATEQYVDSTKAPLNSPALTGEPTATTAAVGNNSTRIATTAFVIANTLRGADFVQSLAANGYQKLPSGLIIQWGTSAGALSGYAVTFPLAFSTACYGVIACNNGSTSYYDTRTYNYTNTNFGISNPGGVGTTNHSWVAIGK